MKLHFSPNSCSNGIHVILEEIGVPYESVRVNFQNREQFSEGFRAINPKGKVPTLVRDDGSVLTEYQAIAFWLGRSFPEAGLLAQDIEGQARALELMDYMVATVHMRGFTFIFAPQRFTAVEAAHDEIRAHGRGIVTDGFAQLGEVLGGRDWLLGDYSIADATMFYLTTWGRGREIPMPDNVSTFHDRMLARPAVQRMLAKIAV